MHNHNLIWIDLEMTGLDVESDKIIEIATVVTDSDLNIIAEGPVFAIHQSQTMLDGMDAWNTKHHGSSGLTTRVQDSRIDEATAEEFTILFLREHITARVSPMCGNSICQDRRFLAKYMPKLEAYFHYRQIDVSTIKELVKRWYPKDTVKKPKKSKHMALSDIKDSIEELKKYRHSVFIK